MAISTTSTASTVPPEPVDPRGLPEGACVDDVDPGRLREGALVVPRSCDEEHRYEVFARADLADAGTGWPGSEQVTEDADRTCSTRFEGFVGAPWAGSTLDYLALAPDEARWGAGERAVVCVLFDLGLVPLEGTMAGSER